MQWGSHYSAIIDVCLSEREFETLDVRNWADEFCLAGLRPEAVLHPLLLLCVGLVLICGRWSPAKVLSN